ncbi:shikimate dehydrogenase family protein [Parerythrobacter jejuensis]|uniref:Shikimate dehydrogenase (NADP(+)) n=1 Tax=Parerythrobacter jejuensis TaxID=795812 RepID=A0A845APZ9_9SPHN|nr:shikimate dehydrogenase [Parerythrobacter jejuensis]MXP30951.1 shikimate dehydrogenase [Parerythrobacter jejuensis]MXP33711.1 shikimate dehydrogenase [Parerythrobacter jejuensis]
MTMPYAEVIGDPIAQSKSPLIHGFWIAKFGLTADYKARHVLAGDLETYLDQRRTDPDWRGCNVTMPHKQAILPLLDHLDPLARQVGAVNTVVRNQDGSLTGFNTDVAGFLEPLASDLQNDHLFRMARILGTGGAARAIVVALADRGFTLVIAGRDPAKAERLLEELAPRGESFTPPLSHFAKATDFAFDDREGCYDLVVNASPLGMTGQPDLPFDVSHAPPGSIIYDIVTSPAQTPLLRDAQANGFDTIDGLSMLIGQAREAFRLFFHETAPGEWDDELRGLLLA